jgi:hypothetical protein
MYLNQEGTMTVTITGTVAGQQTTQNTAIDPFDAPAPGPVVVTDSLGGLDSVTIQLSDNGADGTLTGLGLTGGANGTYTIAAAPAAVITADLQGIAFDPTVAVPNTPPVTTTFDLTVQSNSVGTPTATDDTTTVTNTVTGPTITGTVADQTTTNEAPLDPFSGVAIADSSPGAPTQTLDIQLSDGGLTGVLSGTGVTGGLFGLYTIGPGLSAAAVTADLDAAVFTPTGGTPGSVTPTTFTLTDTSSAVGLPTATDSITTVSNTDPTSSILFQDADGQPSFWQLNGNNLIGGGGPISALGAPTVPLNPGPNWTAIGTGDFYGTSASDILLQNSNGQVATWQMNGNNEVSAGLTTVGGTTVNPGTSWNAVGTGNFTDTVPAPGTPSSDILLQNNHNGQVAIWNMNGSAITGSGVATVGGLPATPGTNWAAVGSGDFTDDGFSDGILLQSASNGSVAIWNMGGTNGTTIESSGLATVGGATAIPGAAWEAIGTGDFTGAGQSDIVLQNSATSQVAIWDMGGTNGTSIIGSGLATVGGAVATPGLDWKAIGTGGLNGSDILFQNTTSGQTATWDMGGTDGTTIISSGLTSPAPGVNLRAVGQA